MRNENGLKDMNDANHADVMNKLKKTEMKTSAEFGAKSAILIISLLLVLIAANFLVSLIPAKILKRDVSPDKVHSLGADTIEYIENIDEDVNLYWVCPGGGEDIYPLTVFMERYASYSKHLKFKTVDPETEKDFIKKYVKDNKNEIPAVILESSKRHKTIDLTDMFFYRNDLLNEQYKIGDIPHNVYMQNQFIFLAAEQQGSPTRKIFCGDKILTLALEYVLRDKIPHIYALSGHGEKTFDETLNPVLEEYGMKPETLVLEGKMPVDANTLVIYAPNSDLTAGEAEEIGSFLEDGGNLYVVTDEKNTKHKNLMGILAPFGLTAEEGVIRDPSKRNHYNEETFIAPDITRDPVIPLDPSDPRNFVFTPDAHAIKTAETEGVTNSPLLTTSNEAVIEKADGSKSPASEFTVGVKSVSGDEGRETRIIWFSSTALFDEEAVKASGGNNYHLAVGPLAWMNEQYVPKAPEAEGAPYDTQPLNEISKTSVYIYAVLLIALLPCSFLIWGICVWVIRKKR